ncbi:MAG: hypothetical protein GQ535_09420 [Rhodobacteraceae bacterium]|nr:hypothetical protein [Paracoccaceae bacterium]
MWRGLVIAAVLASSAQAEAPKSAIDWLSESLLQPPNFVITPPGRTGHPLNTTQISAMPLEMVSRDAAGLLPPDVTGFPRAIWGDTPTADAEQHLHSIKHSDVPEVMALFKQVLLAQSDPPLDAGPKGTLLLARIDLLFAIGALDEAETLILLAGATEPEIFRRWFEIALVGQRTNAPCEALQAQPTLSNDIATRVICLARSGDWNAAAITVSLAESLGQIAVEDADLLVRFLDPEMFAELEDAGNPDPLDPITFTLRESLALPRPDTPLPLPYLNADLNLRTPARQRIVAAERLVRASAIPPSLLFAAYRGARAASSGGAWGRAEYVQELDTALVSEDGKQLAEAISTAMVAFADAGLLYAFADEYADTLAHLPPDEDTGQIAPRIRRLLLIADRPMAQWATLGTADSPVIKIAARLASREIVQGFSPYSAALPNAIHLAFANHTPSKQEIPALLAKIDSGNFAEVLLRALALLADGKDADPQALHEGLFLLRKLGLEDAARRVAIQLLLLGPEPA